MVKDPSETDLRYLNLYDNIDKKRKKTWQKSGNNEQLYRNNVTQLKFLIASNLFKKTKKKQLAKDEEGRTQS